MKRSNIPQEKIPNNLTYMNHHTIGGVDKSESVETFSVGTTLVNGESSSNRFVSDNREISDHIYENVEIPRRGKKKYKSLSELVGSFSSRRLKTYAKKWKSKMLENQNEIDGRLISSSSSTIYSDSQRNEEDDDDLYSYTSCQEENIYENLNFDFQHNWRQSETVLADDAVRFWLDDLTDDVVEYESDVVMISKCIPSRNKSILCHFDYNPVSSASNNQHISALEDYKLDIVNKCFAAVWRQESETEILNNLYVFLSEVFGSFFRRNSAITEQEIVRRKNSSSVRKRRKRRENSYDAALFKSVDKETLQKLETFILSVTLNRLAITYDKPLKFYSALECWPGLSHFDGEIKLVLKFSRLYIERYQQVVDRNQLRAFLRTLKVILTKRFAVTTIAGAESPKAICDTLIKKKSAVEEENIYQPIWKWRTDCNRVNSDNIYADLDFAVESDDNDWEVDSEFCFLNGKQKSKRNMTENMFRNVCILYSEERPELNRILYSYDPTSLLNESSDVTSLKNDKEDSEKPPIVSQVNEKALSGKEPETAEEPESVKAWKILIRSPFYLEDEEDLIMSEKQIASLKINEPEIEEIEPIVLPANDENEKKEVAPKSKLITTSIGSYELKSSVSESSIETTSSVHGNYRNLNENDSNNNSLDNVEVIEEPKKEREKFRDKMKVAFKLKSKPFANQETVDAPKEVEEEFFGSNLETAEKDLEHKYVPKIVVECVSALEYDSNILTPGIYRVSGNKTLIEAFKKKSNEKKSSKKESKNSSLRNQDVHCVTGILKLFFRELNPPLMPTSIFTSCTLDDVTIDKLSALLKTMDPCNYQTLKYLMAHLKRVEQFKSENLMDAKNLAICWGLCLFSSSFENSNQFFENEISKCHVLCKKLIDYNDTIFKM